MAAERQQTAQSGDWEVPEWRIPDEKPTNDNSKLQTCLEKYDGCGRKSVPYVNGNCYVCGRPCMWGREDENE